jgi:glycosyltransferase involved in cell wall biosynthesis
VNLFKLRKLLTYINPDLVHVHYINEWALLSTLTKKRPLIITAWGSDILINKYFGLLKKIFISYIIRKADVITCDANHMVDRIKKHGGDPSKIKLIYFGTDTDMFTPSNKLSNLTESYLDSEKLNILSLRNLEPIYDIETLLQSITIISKKFKEAFFIIGGSGTEEENLKKLAHTLDIEEQVYFTGAINPSTLPIIMAKCDIYVSTSLSDAGLSASTAESMASGLPVVITEGGDNHLWIKNGGNGYIVPQKNPTELANKIIALINDPEKRETFGVLARETILLTNNWDIEMDKMNQLYIDHNQNMVQ